MRANRSLQQRHCERSEAIQRRRAQPFPSVDGFAPLAMTTFLSWLRLLRNRSKANQRQQNAQSLQARSGSSARGTQHVERDDRSGGAFSRRSGAGRTDADHRRAGHRRRSASHTPGVEVDDDLRPRLLQAPRVSARQARLPPPPQPLLLGGRRSALHLSPHRSMASMVCWIGAGETRNRPV